MNVINEATPAPVYNPELYILPGSNNHNAAAGYLYDPDILENGMSAYQFILAQNRQSPVPVTGLQLKTRNSGNSVILSWKTQSERNNKGFEIERSTDGIQFREIAFVNASGTELGSEYQYTDINATNGTNYYRLVQLDMDGRKMYSEIVSINMQLNEKLLIYPNPVKDLLTISNSNVFKNATIRIFDSKGSVRKELQIINSSEKQINVSDLAKGFYTGSITDEGKTISFSFVKN